jgi:signal transduction histidine kinase
LLAHPADRQYGGFAVTGESAPSGLAGRLPPEVAAGLGAISRVARALNRPGTLAELTEHALGEMSGALSLSAAALYLPATAHRPALRRYREATTGPRSREELAFDPEAWRLAIESGHPVVFHEPAGWLVDNPFEPEASYWFALPMLASDELVGVVMAARSVPVELDATTLTVLRLLGDQLSVGVTTARLRDELQRAELERERMRLAADVHDGLAQDLALALREVTLLDGPLSADDARESLARLREAVVEAHRIVRERLVELSSAPARDLRVAVQQVVERFARRGMPITLAVGELGEASPTIVLILSEALSNVERHASASRVDVSVAARDGTVELTVADDGCGFSDAAKAGHFGLGVMRQRAEEAGGTLEITTAPGAGTHVTARLPTGLPADRRAT